MSATPERVYEELLVLRCQSGEAVAFEELVGRYQRRLWRHALRLTGRRDAAWDVLQEAWMSIVRGLSRLDDPRRFQAWAYRIVTHKCADWTRLQQRQRKLRSEMSREGAVDAQPARGAAHEEHERLRIALGRLPPDQRAILSLHYADDLPTAEIAEILEIPPGTVKSRLHHARNQLKRALEARSPNRRTA